MHQKNVRHRNSIRKKCLRDLIHVWRDWLIKPKHFDPFSNLSCPMDMNIPTFIPLILRVNPNGSVKMNHTLCSL